MQRCVLILSNKHIVCSNYSRIIMDRIIAIGAVKKKIAVPRFKIDFKILNCWTSEIATIEYTSVMMPSKAFSPKNIQKTM